MIKSLRSLVLLIATLLLAIIVFQGIIVYINHENLRQTVHLQNSLQRSLENLLQTEKSWGDTRARGYAWAISKRFSQKSRYENAAQHLRNSIQRLNNNESEDIEQLKLNFEAFNTALNSLVERMSEDNINPAIRYYLDVLVPLEDLIDRSLNQQFEQLSKQNIAAADQVLNSFFLTEKRLGILIVSSLLFGGLLTGMIFRIFTRRIDTLIKKIEAIEGGADRKEANKKRSLALFDDELQVVTYAINSMQERIETQTHSLESMLNERDQALYDMEQSKTELLYTMEDLKNAQQHLIQSEKMASLGRLVATIAHEINTPIGNSLTVATSLNAKCNELVNALDSGKLTKTFLLKHVNAYQEAMRILEKSLSMAADQITKFKSVAVDQSHATLRPFNLRNSIEETLSTLRPQLKNTGLQLRVDIPDDIEMNSYPGPISQIVCNCFNNALLHAFEDKRNGTLSIEARTEDDASVTLIFRDDGKGMTEEQLQSIFEPFFTTKLGKGGSGLGMNIVYNLTVDLLKGSISITSEINQGSAFVFKLPLNAG